MHCWNILFEFILSSFLIRFRWLSITLSRLYQSRPRRAPPPSPPPYRSQFWRSLSLDLDRDLLEFRSLFFIWVKINNYLLLQVIFIYCDIFFQICRQFGRGAVPRIIALTEVEFCDGKIPNFSRLFLGSYRFRLKSSLSHSEKNWSCAPVYVSKFLTNLKLSLFRIDTSKRKRKREIDHWNWSFEIKIEKRMKIKMII